jgi:hypothetical protein
MQGVGEGFRQHLEIPRPQMIVRIGLEEDIKVTTS